MGQFDWRVAVGRPEWAMTTKMRTRAKHAEDALLQLLDHLDECWHEVRDEGEFRDHVGGLIDEFRDRLDELRWNAVA